MDESYMTKNQFFLMYIEIKYYLYSINKQYIKNFILVTYIISNTINNIYWFVWKIKSTIFIEQRE